MSHFNVLIIGEDPESQLAPYHEFESTGEYDEYVEDIDITDEIRAEYEAEKHNYDRISEFCVEWRNLPVVYSVDELTENHKYGYAIIDNDGNLIQAVNRTNPCAKWDWYELGGRWTGFFKLKPGASGEVGLPGIGTDSAAPGYADQARKGDIDFDGMRQAAVAAAAKSYDEFHAILAKHPGTKSLEACFASHPDTQEGRSAAKDEYNKQPCAQEFDEAGFFLLFDDIFKRFCIPRDEFLARAFNSAISTYAFINEGAWVACGDMGWWGISSNEIGEDAWNARFNAMLDELPDDTLLSLYDCHI